MSNQSSVQLMKEMSINVVVGRKVHNDYRKDFYNRTRIEAEKKRKRNEDNNCWNYSKVELLSSKRTNNVHFLWKGSYSRSSPYRPIADTEDVELKRQKLIGRPPDTIRIESLKVVCEMFEKFEDGQKTLPYFSDMMKELLDVIDLQPYTT
ncbi:hypothetical protein PR048_005249 [Dryococelus australis]|uniref:Uncharacterized protein n=1 Tax=Dryococelus australis TaxID=614101 RepID=A0ABQ9I7P4_9NEOP|nr:hypothetical protein PR048_005249 [Dryococelus australis]